MLLILKWYNVSYVKEPWNLIGIQHIVCHVTDSIAHFTALLVAWISVNSMDKVPQVKSFSFIYGTIIMNMLPVLVILNIS